MSTLRSRETGPSGSLPWLYFETTGVNPAWHAPGWALLTPIYLAMEGT